MITLISKEKTISFNLKTGHAREIDLCLLITSFQLKKYDASIKIKTSFDENFNIKTQDVLDIKFNEGLYEL